MEDFSPCHKPRIFLSGETGGTGASTTSKLLARHLAVPLISGGRYYRAIARHFDSFCEEQRSSTDAVYQRFLNSYQEQYELTGIQGANSLLEPFQDCPPSEDVLSNFNRYVAVHATKDGGLDSVWDYIINEKLLSEALQQPGFVVESKLAVVSVQIDQMLSVVKQYNNLVLPYLAIVLSLDPQVAASRISQRENHNASEQDVLSRKAMDWARYSSLYTLGGRPLKHSDLYRLADEVINTEQQSPEQVTATILEYYSLKIGFLSQAEQALAQPILIRLNQALQNLGESTPAGGALLPAH